MPLTNTALRNLKPTDKTRKVADEKGLYIEVALSGGKWWRLKYRIAGKEKRLALGVYPDVSLKDARDRRDDARKLLAKGIDPSEHKKNEKKAAAVRLANDFESVAREWFSRHSKNWADGHSDRIMARLERDVFSRTLVAGRSLRLRHLSSLASCARLKRERWILHTAR